MQPHFRTLAIARIDWAEVEQFIAIKLSDGYSPKKTRDTVSVVSLIMKDGRPVWSPSRQPGSWSSHPQRQAKKRRAEVLTMEMRAIESYRSLRGWQSTG